MENKIYAKKSEKVIDFLIGFLLIPVLIGISYPSIARSLGATLASIVFWLELLVVIYLSVKRVYIRIGVLLALVAIPLVALGACLLIIKGMHG
jgi:hypothetical protein